MKIQKYVLWGVTLLVLVFVNYQTYQREQIVLNGRVVLLQLAPVDPRSLIQGDYMRLRYAIANSIDDATDLERGYVVVHIDSNNVAHYARIHNTSSPLADNEILLPFRQESWGQPYVGPMSFFFQEGHAKYYNDAAYGEIRVSKSGSILLVGLRDSNLKPLGPPK